MLLLVPSDELPFGLVGEETTIVALLLTHRLLLLRYILLVSHAHISYWIIPPPTTKPSLYITKD